MNKRFRIRLLSVLLSMILMLSVPLAAYAQEELPALSSNEEISAAEEQADFLSEETESTEDDAFFDVSEDEFLPDDAILIEDPEGSDEVYLVEIEEEDEKTDYSSDLLDQILTELALQDDTAAPDIIEAVYEAVLSSLPKGATGEAAVCLLADVLDETGIQYCVLNGINQYDTGIFFVIVKIAEDEPYYILDPEADLTASDGGWNGFLLGLNDRKDWILSEEFLTEAFHNKYPISKDAYQESEKDSDSDTEDEFSAEPENADESAFESEPDKSDEMETEDIGTVKSDDVEPEDIGTVKSDDIEPEDFETDESDTELFPDVKTDDQEPCDPNAEGFQLFEQGEVQSAEGSTTTWDSGSCGAYANWALLYDTDQYTWTLSITGSGSMYNYGYTYDSDSGEYSTTAPWKGYYFDRVTIGPNITSIGQYAFIGNSYITTLTFKGTSVTSIGDYAFYRCSCLTKASIPSGVTSIGYAAFYYCSSLKAAYLPSSLKTIGGYAFCNCGELSKITIKGSVTSIGAYALYSCADVYYAKSSTAWSSIGGNNAISSATKMHYNSTRKSIKNAKVTLTRTSYGYTGKAIKPGVKVKLGSKTLKRGTDYKVSYKNNKKRGKATVTITGIKKYRGTVRKTFKIVRKNIKNAKVSGVKNRYYTGKAIKLSLTVKIKVGSKYVTLKRGRDYKVKYKNNKKVSTSSSKAQVIITGIGNYKGTIKKSFKIIRRSSKLSPKLKFSQKTVTRTARSAFTKKVKKGVSAKLTLTYKSSNTKVATVNKKTGKVTPKGVGTTRITVTSKATKKYKAGKASYKLTIRPYKFSALNYSFANYGTSYIPESTFRIFFESVEAKSYYNAYYNAGSNGVCYGMSASSLMFNAGGSKLSKYSFRPSADRLYDLSRYDTYRSSGIYLTDLIEAMFLSQVCSEAQSCRNKHVGDYSGLVRQVKSGKPVMVSIRANGGGHAIVAYKVSISSSYARVYVYDCNHPTDSSRYITLYRSGGSYTGWYYNLGSQSWSSSIGGTLSYITTPEYRKIWTNRKGNSALSKMILSSDDFEIRNAQGELVASMVNGEFSSTNEDIQMMVIDGEQPDTHLVYVPVGAYTVTNTSDIEKGLEITALNVNQSISVSTESDTVLMDVNDETGINKASFTAAEGDVYEVILMSDLPSAEGKEEVSYSGIGTGSEVTLGMENGACIIEDAEDVTLEINGEEIAYVIFDGEAVMES